MWGTDVSEIHYSALTFHKPQKVPSSYLARDWRPVVSEVDFSKRFTNQNSVHIQENTHKIVQFEHIIQTI